MKRFVFFTLVLIFTSLFSSCKKKQQEEEQIVLFMAEENPPGTISGLMDRAFKNKVYELSDGKIVINLQFNGVLGNSGEILDEMVKGQSLVDIVRISAIDLSARGCDRTALLTLPYTFDSIDHYWKFATSSLANDLLREPYEKKLGLIGIFWGEEGFRNFFSVKPLKRSEDFEGLKLRVTNDKAMRKIADCLKSSYVPVDFTEMYESLQNGTIDAAEQPVINYLENEFYEIAPYLILDEHTLGVTEVVISSTAWETLTTNQQEILTQAGKYAGEYCKLISKELISDAYEKLEKKGVSISKLTDSLLLEQNGFQIIDEFTKDNRDLYNTIIKMKED